MDEAYTGNDGDGHQGVRPGLQKRGIEIAFLENLGGIYAMGAATVGMTGSSGYMSLVLRTAKGSSVDFAKCVSLAAFKPPTDFCRRGLVYGTAVSKQAALKDEIVEDKIVEDKIVEERKRYGKQSDKRG